MGSALDLRWRDFEGTAVETAARPLHALLAAPSLLYLATLGIMLFRPPDLEFYCVDRIAFVILTATVLLRAMLFRQTILPRARVLLPMAGLVLLVFADLLTRPFEIQMWSVAAAKFFVPYGMFCLAGLVFADARSLRRLELFAIGVLAYLIMTALASMTHLDLLVVPKFILDPGIGTHFLRARGPFLQAVANGVALNALGLIALDAFGRRRLPLFVALPLLSTLPMAIVATETRSVWLSFALSIALLLVWTPSTRVRMVCAAFVVAGGLGLALFIAGSSPEDARERLLDGETVDFRMAAYEAGWEMFVERPVLGWGSSRIQTELADRIRGFHGDVFAVHNTYFEILLEYGMVGFLLYAWVLMELVRLGRSSAEGGNNGFLQNRFRGKLWRLLLAVYLINATFVVMNYQFVNGLVFTMAGILARDVYHRAQKQQWPMGAAVA